MLKFNLMLKKYKYRNSYQQLNQFLLVETKIIGTNLFATSLKLLFLSYQYFNRFFSLFNFILQ